MSSQRDPQHVHTFISSTHARYFLSLQLKEDLVNMKLVCSDETYSILAGFVVQGEFGDYDPMDHTPGYLDDFPFLETRSAGLKTNVEELHQKNRSVLESVCLSVHLQTLFWCLSIHVCVCRGLLPAECDRRFMDLACRIDRYGMDFHQVLVSG